MKRKNAAIPRLLTLFLLFASFASRASAANKGIPLYLYRKRPLSGPDALSPKGKTLV